MAAVSETIVREFFELAGFLVRQERKFVAATRREEERQVDFLVINPAPQPLEQPRPFVLTSREIGSITRGIVVVKGWHTETFSPGVLASAEGLFRFVSPGVFKRAAQALGGTDPALHILVVPALPQDETSRRKSIAFLQEKGVDAVLPFHTMLAGLIESVQPNRNYQKSDLLQILRILKTYDFFKEPQLELFRPRRRRND